MTSGGEEFDKGVYIMLLVIVYVQCFVLFVCVRVCVAGCSRRFLSPSSRAEEEEAAGED